jgi:hypothetical protein
LLRTHGLAPPVFGTFLNGFACGYFPGAAIGPEHVIDPRIFPKIASRFALLVLMIHRNNNHKNIFTLIIGHTVVIAIILAVFSHHLVPVNCCSTLDWRYFTRSLLRTLIRNARFLMTSLDFCRRSTIQYSNKKNKTIVIIIVIIISTAK